MNSKNVESSFRLSFDLMYIYFVSYCLFNFLYSDIKYLLILGINGLCGWLKDIVSEFRIYIYDISS